MKVVRTLVLLFAASGCATSDPGLDGMHDPAAERPPTPAPSQAAAPTPKREKVSLFDYAKSRYRTAAECEYDAASLRRVKPLDGWAMFIACAHRDDFVDIMKITADPWLEDIRRDRKNGVRVAAKVLANRGGNMDADLQMVNDAGVQLFRLEDALVSAEVFRGRYVLMRGKVVKKEVRGDATRFVVAETSLTAQNFKKNYSWDVAAQERAKGRNREATQYPGGRNAQIVVGTRNVAEATNRRVEAWTRRAQDELVSDQEFLFLVRFDELTATEPDAATNPQTQTARAALVDAWRPIAQ